jgi:hypothetical protein
MPPFASPKGEILQSMAIIKSKIISLTVGVAKVMNLEGATVRGFIKI